jgi:hypothetical protein
MKYWVYMLVFCLSVITIFAETVPNKLRVKLANYSVNLDSLDELDFFLGDYSAETMIRPAMLQKINYKSNRLLGAKKNIRLDLIYEIEFSNDARPELIASKLSKLPYFEYVEPIYKRKLFQAPNDTMLPEQYYLFNSQAYQAWDIIRERDINDTVTIAIIDTGVDIEHPDLVQNLRTNIGETGLDENQNDKRTNGIDDDRNGFVDDWFGWDFTGGPSGLQEDNQPLPGHSHGTHVAGICAATHNNIAGIAGTAINVKYYPVKIGYDNPNSVAIANGYEGILYAAMMGCEIINCSWGGSGFSNAEQDVIDKVITLGSTIIASSGNDGEEKSMYPASYAGVISVASSDKDDDISRFSNYGYAIDVVAPGRQILSTVAGDGYEKWNGTSMAAPVASSVAAMIRMNNPENSAIEIGERLKASCDDIDSVIGKDYRNKIGAGRVNAVKALTSDNPRTLIVKNIRTRDLDGDNQFRAGDTLELTLDIQAKLGGINDLKLYLRDNNDYGIKFDFLNNMLPIGNIAKDEIIEDIGPIAFIVPKDNNLYDLKMDMEIKILNTKDFTHTTGTNITIYPTFMTFDFNDLKTTVNSRGNVAYNDYGTNEQGIGFQDKYGNAMLYEGSLMIATSLDSVSDVARGETGKYANKDFLFTEIINQTVSDKELVGKTAFSDTLPFIDIGLVNVAVEQTIIQKKSEENPLLNDMIFFQYDYIKLKKSSSSFYAGLYFDWDMGFTSADDKCYYDYENDCGISISTDSLSTIIAVKLLSDRTKNFYALNNNGETLDDLGVYNGFTDNEKYLALSSGFEHDTSRINDISMIIGTGPNFINANDTLRDTYVIFTAYGEEDLKNKSEFLERYKHELNSNGGTAKNISGEVFPNPCVSGTKVTVKFNLEKSGDIEAGLYDLAGKTLEIKKINNAANGEHSISFDTNDLMIGTYFISIQTDNTKFYKKLIITK